MKGFIVSVSLPANCNDPVHCAVGCGVIAFTESIRKSFLNFIFFELFKTTWLINHNRL